MVCGGGTWVKHTEWSPVSLEEDTHRASPEGIKLGKPTAKKNQVWGDPSVMASPLSWRFLPLWPQRGKPTVSERGIESWEEGEAECEVERASVLAVAMVSNGMSTPNCVFRSIRMVK